MDLKFNENLLGLIGINLLSGLLIISTLGLATPFAVCMKKGWYSKHTIIDDHQVTFDGNGVKLFGNYMA